MEYKIGEKVKVNPKTLNKDIKGNRRRYIGAWEHIGEELHTVKKIGDSHDNMGTRIHLRSPTIGGFWVYKKDIIPIRKYEQKIGEKYAI